MNLMSHAGNKRGVLMMKTAPARTEPSVCVLLSLFSDRVWIRLVVFVSVQTAERHRLKESERSETASATQYQLSHKAFWVLPDTEKN